MPLKVTTWNIEHAHDLVSENDADRINRIRETIELMSPDILLMTEGPKGEEGIVEFCAVVLNNQWVPVLLKQPTDNIGDKDSDYGNDGRGTQWVWYIIKTAIAGNCRAQAASVWNSFVGNVKWSVNYWGKIDADNHDHYRQPQVMIYTLPTGREIEFIGVHLKSKYNTQAIEHDDEGNLIGSHLEVGLKARVKLATEARNVRNYINAKFNQLTDPALVILGDCNDGPGNDFFESQYLFFDLIQNLQGEILHAERFFNHALFDYQSDLRWTAKFRDPILRISAGNNPLLLDHILMSQSLCNGNLPLKVNANAGKVEHEIFERVNAGSNGNTRSSDHRPVSCIFDDN